MKIVALILAFFGVLLLFALAWRWASRRWSIPCPAFLAWSLETPSLQRFNGTQVVLDRLDLRPGQRVLEIGPGPGRLLIPAAQQVSPGGEAIGIDIQRAMLDRLKRRAAAAGLTNLTVILGHAAHPHVATASMDTVFLCAVLGEIPERDRAAALAECCRALKSGGVLSITEMFGDPHYQFQSSVRRLAEGVGLRFRAIRGGWWLYTAEFTKP
jgi:ubiquinone/menaquinone biosynthesis C-methylase UbiE